MADPTPAPAIADADAYDTLDAEQRAAISRRLRRLPPPMLAGETGSTICRRDSNLGGSSTAYYHPR